MIVILLINYHEERFQTSDKIIMDFIPGNSLQKKDYSDLISSILDERFLLLNGPTDYEGILQITDKSTSKVVGLFMTGDELIPDDATEYFCENPVLFEMEGMHHSIVHDSYRTESFMNEIIHAKFRKYQEIRLKEVMIKTSSYKHGTLLKQKKI